MPFLSSISTETLESWRELFNLLLILATFAVCIGVYLEKDGHPEDVQEFGWGLVLRGIAFELLFAVLLWQLDSTISYRQKREIVALETRLSARILSDEQIAAIADRLRPFSGQVFQVIPYWKNPESFSIANRIADALIKAGWKLENPKVFTTMVGVVTGVAVDIRKGAPEKIRDAANELVSALNAEDVQTTLEEEENLNPTDQISLSVGIKP